MPIYDYECQSCGHQAEVLQKISAEPLVECPKCGASTYKKLLSAPTFKLKGTGWYETDFKNKSKPAASGKSADSGSSKTGGTSSSAE